MSFAARILSASLALGLVGAGLCAQTKSATPPRSAPARAASSAGSQARAGATRGGFNVPVEYYKLPNGLRVALSPDHSAPTVAVAVYYRIGFRVEPRDRTGFAHLFAHLMLLGSQNLG